MACQNHDLARDEGMVRALGIEPRTPAWKAGVLPLNYARTERVMTITGLTLMVKLQLITYKTNRTFWQPL